MRHFTEQKILLRVWPGEQYLSIWHLAPGIWSFCHGEGGRKSRVGPMYPTKAALLLEVSAYAKSWEQ